MARIMDLDEASFPYAAMLGRAMQYINFIRDIAEDNGLGRRYLPLLDTPLEALSEKEAKKNPEAFSAFIRREIERYQGW
jgi:phytoene synthase